MPIRTGRRCGGSGSAPGSARCREPVTTSSDQRAFVTADMPGLARSLCARRTGGGADGLVISARLIDEPPESEVRCINPDGSDETMCGDARRCAALCAAIDRGPSASAASLAGVRHQAEVHGDEVAVVAEAEPVHRAGSRHRRQRTGVRVRRSSHRNRAGGRGRGQCGGG